jgi:ankyrin repeat protein
MIECQDLGGRTPFMWALRYSDTEMIEAVLGHSANISHTDNSGNQAVFYAAGCTLSPVIRDLIRDSGPIQDATIARAVTEGNVQLVRQFLESGANPSAILKDGSTVLHLAVLIYPDTTTSEMVSLLLQWKTNVNAQDSLNRTALHLCFVTSPKSLIALTATTPAPNFNLQDNNGNSPIHLAAQSLHKSAFEELGPRSPMKHLTELDVNVFLANNNGDTPLHIAASYQNREGMSDLLARAGVQQLQNPEYNLNVKNSNRQIILELAFESNHQPMVDLLLQNEGIDVDAQGANGGHALKWAAIKGMYETAKVIMKRSVTNLNTAECYGYTALHDAAIHNSLEVTKSLLQYHADIMLLNCESKMPLLEAAQHGSFEVLERLLREQERLNAIANMDWTTYANNKAILLATQSGDLKCLELLMKPYGHQLNERNSDEGSTPLHYSVLRRSLPIVKFLLARGADPNLLTTHGKTALDLALDVGEGQIIEALLEHNALSGLPWEMSLLTKKWISESWYPTLQWQLTASKRWDMAKCNKARTTWARITRCMTAPAEVSEKTPDKPYLEIAIPQGGQSPVRRIRFQIRSHDQGKVLSMYLRFFEFLIAVI